MTAACFCHFVLRSWQLGFLRSAISWKKESYHWPGFFRCTQIRELASMLSPKFYCLRRRKLNSRVKKPVISDWFSVLVIETSQHCALQQFPVFILTGLRTENLTLFYNVHLLKQRIKTVSAILLTFLSRKKLVIRPISLIIWKRQWHKKCHNH